MVHSRAMPYRSTFLGSLSRVRVAIDYVDGSLVFWRRGSGWCRCLLAVRTARSHEHGPTDSRGQEQIDAQFRRCGRLLGWRLGHTFPAPCPLQPRPELTRPGTELPGL